MRIGVIIDNGQIAEWQLAALRHVLNGEISLLLNCTNTRTQKRPLTNFFYYFINLISIQNPQTRKIPVPQDILDEATIIDFQSEYRDQWQRLPEPIIKHVNDERIDVLVKFGMSLLIVPEGNDLAVPILSYHHGDPETYRGRPAGFYELLDNTDHIGMVVQKLSNKLDAGEIYAYGEARIYDYSYKRTLVAAYRASSLLLNIAVKNLAAGRPLNRSVNGKNYRLPGNLTVTRFILKVATNLMHWLFYGAFYEKKWKVSVCQSNSIQNFIDNPFPVKESVLPVSDAFAFYADPFFLNTNTLLLEAMSNRTGKGQIIQVSCNDEIPLTDGTKHFSYPAVTIFEGQERFLAEIADWGAPKWFILMHGEITETIEITGLKHDRILDATYFFHDGHHYIFGTKNYLESNILHLWYANNIDGPYKEHTENPICLSPRGARMAGNIFVENGALYRLGQDFTGKYGNGAHLYEIEQLTPQHYVERRIARCRFLDRCGPHTINQIGQKITFDWYDDCFSIFAGWRRFKARVLQR